MGLGAKRTRTFLSDILRCDVYMLMYDESKATATLKLCRGCDVSFEEQNALSGREERKRGRSLKLSPTFWEKSPRLLRKTPTF